MPKASTPAYSFLVDYLQRKPDASFAEIRDAAAKRNLKIVPVSYGRAKLQLGLVKQGGAKKKAGKKGAAKKAAAKAAVTATGEAPRKRGRPKGSKNKPKVMAAAPSHAASGSVDDIVGLLRSMQRERDELRAVLARIRGLVGGSV